MTLHPYIGLSELIEYCQLCHEQGGKVSRVKIDDKTLEQVRRVARISGETTEFLGIKFLSR